MCDLDVLATIVIGPAEIDHVSKKLPILSCLLYHNLQTIYTNKIKSLSLLQWAFF